VTLTEQLDEARAQFIKHPTNAKLRAFLTLKARLGRFDKRMCMHFAVDPNVKRRVSRCHMPRLRRRAGPDIHHRRTTRPGLVPQAQERPR
jgi:hypothetical protein